MSKLKLCFRIWTGVVFAPFVFLGIGVLLSNILGCDVHEGNMQPCKVLFFDIGGLLYALGVSGWFMLLSIIFGPIGYLTLGIINFVVKRNENKKNKNGLRKNL